MSILTSSYHEDVEERHYDHDFLSVDLIDLLEIETKSDSVHHISKEIKIVISK